MHTTTDGKPAQAAARDSGFTVIELMVAVAIFIIVMGSVYAMVEVGRKARFTTLQKNEAVQNVRTALNTMRNDALNSGIQYPNVGALIPNDWLNAHLGLPLNSGSGPDSLTPVIAGYQVNAINEVNALGATVAVRTDQVTFVSQDDSFNGGIALPISKITNSGANLTIDTSKASQGNSVCSKGDIYIITGVNNSAIGMVTNVVSTDTVAMASSDPLGVNQPGTNSPIALVSTPASASRVNWVTYLLVDDGNGTGTLVRRIYGGLDPKTKNPLGTTDQPLAFEVLGMTVSYSLSDGRVVNNPASADLQDIREVTISVTVRSPERDPVTNQPLLSTLVTTINTRNLGFEKKLS